MTSTDEAGLNSADGWLAQRKAQSVGDAVPATFEPEEGAVATSLSGGVASSTALEDLTLRLPNELMLAILLHVVHVGACASVCRRWHALCQDKHVKKQRWALRWDDYANGTLCPRIVEDPVAPAERVLGLAVSQDGSTLFTVHGTHVRRWQLNLGHQPLREHHSTILTTGLRYVGTLTVDADGTVFVGGCYKVNPRRRGAVVAFSGETGEEIQNYSAPVVSVVGDHVTSLAVSVTRVFGITNPWEGSTIIQWNRSTGELLDSLTGHTKQVRCLAVGYGKLFSGSDDGTARVWSAVDGAHVATIGFDNESIVSLAIGNNVLAVGSVKVGHRVFDDGNCGSHIRLWSLNGGEEYKSLIACWMIDTVVTVALSADNTLFSVEELDGNAWIFVFRPLAAHRSKRRRMRKKTIRPGGKNPGSELALSPDGTLFMTTCSGVQTHAIYAL